jgi:CRP/FNR family transcriptional regulator
MQGEEFTCQTCKSRNKSIFAALGVHELEMITGSKWCACYKKGQSVFVENSYPHGIYCINEGKVKVSKMGETGKEQIVRFAKGGDVLGYRALLSADKYEASATALEDCNICFIPKDILFRLVEDNTAMSFRLMQLLAKDLKGAEERLTHTAQKPIRERVAESLLFIKRTYGTETDGETINVQLSREEIANLVGTTTESTIRTLSDFNKENVIELNGKKIKIVNSKKLLAIANVEE